LHEALLEEPELQVSLLLRLAFDLRQAQRRIMMLGQHNICQRLASFIIELSQHPDFYNKRTHHLEVPVTRSDLADYLGTASETVIRAFSKLEKNGLIRRISPSILQIQDLDALRKLLHEKRRVGRT
jgi:CRP-like cAMP-binding protein